MKPARLRLTLSHKASMVQLPSAVVAQRSQVNHCPPAAVHSAERCQLRQRLLRLDDVDVDWVIYGILCLSRTENQNPECSESILSFIPHAPSANW